MPVKFDGIEVKRSESCRFHPEDLVFSEFTGRRHGASESDIDKMVKSLLLPAGQLQDIGVRKDFSGKPVIIFGHTRVQAARRINAQKLTSEPFLIRGSFFNVNEEEAAIMTIRENDDDTRTPISCIDLAYLVRELETRYGYSNQSIADKLGKQATQLSLYRKLLTLDNKTQETIAHNRMSLNTALSIVNVAPEDRESVLALAAEGKRVTSTSIAKVAKEAGANTQQSFKHTLSDLKKVLGETKSNYLAASILSYLNGDMDNETLLAVLSKEQ